MFSCHNSITKTKSPWSQFSKRSPVNWYSCGPTVYNNSHLGHARTFSVFDSMRRFVTNLGYDVRYAMNITDIDDKILKKVYEKHCKRLVATELPEMYKEDHTADELVSIAEDNFTEEKLTPSYEIYEEFVETKEAEFWEDMEAIGVEKPDIVLRVRDNVEKLIQYILQIIENGYAYSNNGSVYLDSEAYKAAGYNFGPLCDHDVDKDKSIKDAFVGEKKHQHDFALWKAIKPTEIGFKAPEEWGGSGMGRPGWHLECSFMIHSVFGTQLHIHSGGIDLKFPHHNNEWVQSTAYNDFTREFAKMFLHAGHLMIKKEGEADAVKMSQSKMNFTTIREFLVSGGTQRQLRLLFAYHQWDKPMVLSDSAMDEVKAVEHHLVEAFKNLNHYIKNGSGTNEDTHIEVLDRTIVDLLLYNFQTREAMETLLSFIHSLNKKIDTYTPRYLEQFKTYMEEFLYLFGVEISSGSKSDATPFVEEILTIREQIRALAKDKSKDVKQLRNALFTLTDQIRDEDMVKLGVVVEDRTGEATKWSYA